MPSSTSIWLTSSTLDAVARQRILWSPSLGSICGTFTTRYVPLNSASIYPGRTGTRNNRPSSQLWASRPTGLVTSLLPETLCGSLSLILSKHDTLPSSTSNSRLLEPRSPLWSLPPAIGSSRAWMGKRTTLRADAIPRVGSFVELRDWS